MERLTARNADGSAFYKDCFAADAPCGGGMPGEDCTECGMAQKQCDELAAYEDTGLEPEEAKQLAADRRISLADEATAEYLAYLALGTIDDLTALAKARDEGRVVVLPCKVGDTVYIAASCEEICMHVDNAYETGTGATECPFENTCDIEECDDNHIRIFETKCAGFMLDKNGTMLTFFDGLSLENACTCWGKTVFLTRAEAEAALKGASDG